MSDDFIRIRCPGCSRTCKAPPSAAGRAVKCATCSTAIVVPAAGGAPAGGSNGDGKTDGGNQWWLTQQPAPPPGQHPPVYHPPPAPWPPPMPPGPREVEVEGEALEHLEAIRRAVAEIRSTARLIRTLLALGIAVFTVWFLFQCIFGSDRLLLVFGMPPR